MLLQPYLSFDGDCEAAFRFYAEVLDGTIEAMMTNRDSPVAGETPADWQDKILHASLRVDDEVLMASDAPPGMYSRPQGLHVSIGLSDVARAERIFNALAEGGTVQMPFEETFWALRFGMVADRFGTPWMINCEKPT
ncbi:MAG TPA: VOC family protein [Gemmatimonadaceae bacterium]|nr:VOC family protein [Gemmatimonadaceae bacterium]